MTEHNHVNETNNGIKRNKIWFMRKKSLFAGKSAENGENSGEVQAKAKDEQESDLSGRKYSKVMEGGSGGNNKSVVKVFQHQQGQKREKESLLDRQRRDSSVKWKHAIQTDNQNNGNSGSSVNQQGSTTNTNSNSVAAGTGLLEQQQQQQHPTCVDELLGKHTVSNIWI